MSVASSFAATNKYLHISFNHEAQDVFNVECFVKRGIKPKKQNLTSRRWNNGRRPRDLAVTKLLCFNLKQERAPVGTTSRLGSRISDSS